MSEYEEKLCLFAEFFIKHKTMPTIKQAQDMGLKKEFYWRFETQLKVIGRRGMMALCLNFLIKRGAKENVKRNTTRG